MVIYLVGKGSAFSPARSTTAAAVAKKKKKRSWAAPRKRSGRKWEKGTENISLVSVSPATPTLPPTLPHRCNGSEGLATDSEGREERITCQYLLPAAAWIETDTLHSLSLVSPPKPIQELYLCLGSRGLQGVAWEKADSDGGHRGKVCVWSKGGEWMSNADKQRFLWPRNKNKRRVDISHSKSLEGKQ